MSKHWVASGPRRHSWPSAGWLLTRHPRLYIFWGTHLLPKRASMPAVQNRDITVPRAVQSFGCPSHWANCCHVPVAPRAERGGSALRAAVGGFPASSPSWVAYGTGCHLHTVLLPPCLMVKRRALQSTLKTQPVLHAHTEKRGPRLQRVEFAPGFP